MCANLDASNISTVCKNSEELQKTTGDNMLECKRVQVSREPDIFEQEINKVLHVPNCFLFDGGRKDTWHPYIVIFLRNVLFPKLEYGRNRKLHKSTSPNNEP